MLTPGRVPTNCKFEIDDLEADWTYTRKFEYIHGRELEGSVCDYDRLFKQCFDYLRPGGFLEMQSIKVNTTSDDGSHESAKNTLKIAELILQASRVFGKDMNTVRTWKERMELVGFTNVTERIYKVRSWGPIHLMYQSVTD